MRCSFSENMAEYIEVEGDYALVQTPGKAHLLRETMSSLAARLGPGILVRIHYSAIVRLSAIKELRAAFGWRLRSVSRR